MADRLARKGFREALGETLRRRRRLLGAGSAVLGGAIGGAAMAQLPFTHWASLWPVVGALSGAALGAGGFFSLELLLETHALLRETSLRIPALVNVRPLAGARPVDLESWAASPVLIDTVLRHILRSGARSIVECGSGWSTVLIARCLQELGRGHVVAIEHDRSFAEQTTALLEQHGAAERATVVHAALEIRELDGETWSWFGPAADAAVGGEIDLLLVDGPPGHVHRRMRYPAVPILRDRLSDGAVVVLDDGLRTDERWAAVRWSRLLGVQPRLVRHGQGIWIFDLNRRPGARTDRPR